VFSRVKLPEIQHTEAPQAADGTRHGLWSCRLFTFGLFALFCYEVAEISINSFFINYVTEDGWLDARDAAMILSFGGLGLFMLGRFVGSWVMRYVRAERALLCCAVGAVVTVGLVLADLGTVSRISLLLVYVCEAIMFPTIFAIALKGLGIYTQRASSYLMMSPIGGAVGPLLMGYVADQTTMTFSFIVPLVAFAVVLAYAGSALRHS
jgi:FHS family L-fucose permease-like MFS transporter